MIYFNTKFNIHLWQFTNYCQQTEIYTNFVQLSCCHFTLYKENCLDKTARILCQSMITYTFQGSLAPLTPQRWAHLVTIINNMMLSSSFMKI
jgi:hypothetical protein